MKLIAIFMAACAAATGSTFLSNFSSSEPVNTGSVLVQASANIAGTYQVQPLTSVQHGQVTKIEFGELDGAVISLELTPELNPKTPFVTVSMIGQQDVILPITGDLQQIEVTTSTGKPVTILLGLNLNASSA